MTLGAGIELGVVALALLTLVLVAWALMDVVRQPPRAWEASGARKGLWIALILAGATLPVPGILAPLAYLFGVRRRLARATSRPG